MRRLMLMGGLVGVGMYSKELMTLGKEYLLPMIMKGGMPQINFERLDIVITTCSIISSILFSISLITLVSQKSDEMKAKRNEKEGQYIQQEVVLTKHWKKVTSIVGVLNLVFVVLWVMI